MGASFDELVVERLEATGGVVRKVLPKPGGFRLFETRGQLAARTVLFIGVVDLRSFQYEAIREFARRALASLAGAKPAVVHVTFTLHGAGYGLDESEAFRAERAGIVDAIESGDCPAALNKVTIVERNAGRARRLQGLLAEMQPARLSPGLVRSHQPLSQLEPLRTACLVYSSIRKLEELLTRELGQLR